MSMTPGTSATTPAVDGSPTVGICPALIAACAAATWAIGPIGRHAHADSVPAPPPVAAGACSTVEAPRTAPQRASISTWAPTWCPEVVALRRAFSAARQAASHGAEGGGGGDAHAATSIMGPPTSLTIALG